MPRFTNEEHENILNELANSNGDVSILTANLQRLRENYAECEEEMEKEHQELETQKTRVRELEKQNLNLFMRVTDDKANFENGKKHKSNEDEEEEKTYSLNDLFKKGVKL